MIAACPHSVRKKHGKDRKGNQRFRCKDCGTTFVSDEIRPLGDMRIDLDEAVMALNLLLEGMSVRGNVAHAKPTFHTANQRSQQEPQAPCGHASDLHHVVQLRPQARDHQDDARNG